MLVSLIDCYQLGDLLARILGKLKLHSDLRNNIITEYFYNDGALKSISKNTNGKIEKYLIKNNITKIDNEN